MATDKQSSVSDDERREQEQRRSQISEHFTSLHYGSQLAPMTSYQSREGTFVWVALMTSQESREGTIVVPAVITTHQHRVDYAWLAVKRYVDEHPVGQQDPEWTEYQQQIYRRHFAEPDRPHSVEDTVD